MAIPLRTCVWGELWRDNLVESGCYPSEAVAITGNWRYDEIGALRMVNIPSNEAFTQCFDKCCRVISIFSAAAETEAYVRICLDLVSEFNDTIPIVKVHPSESTELVKGAISAAGFSAETLYSGNLGELLARSSIVISQFSTVVTEAIVLDKPVIIANLTGLVFANEYQASGACLYATTIEELRDCLIRVISDNKTIEDLAEGRKRFIDQTFFRLDGASAQRVASLVQATVEGLR
jgi:glycosyltransferase involved in cell wall biosynthesis